MPAYPLNLQPSKQGLIMGLNRYTAIGNLGADPEMKNLPSGDTSANFNIAVTEHWTDQQGQRQERTEWVRCVAYRRLAETCGNYLRKGSKVYIEGRLQTRKWIDQQGAERHITEIVLDDMQMLDRPPQNQQGGGYQQQNQQQGRGGYQQQRQQGGQQQYTQRQGYQQQQQQGGWNQQNSWQGDR